MTQTTPIPDEKCPACEKPIAPSAAAEGLQFCQHCRLPLAIVANKYRIEKPLAEGGCGILYLARHTQLTMEPMRVLKFLKPEFFSHPNAAQRFAREVEITAALSQRNNHIVRVYDDFGEIPGLGHYYVMEYLRGADLNTRLREKTMPLDTILHVANQILEAIQDAHEAQIVHRDLKPHNVFLIERGKDTSFVKVIDFGIAKGLSAFADTGMTQGVLGTPEYMAPEQCTGQSIDQRTDIYAIGMMLYEMLVGHTPFLPPNAKGISAMNMAIAQMMEAPRTPREAKPERDIPPAIEAVIMRAIAKSPEDRWPTATAMREALQNADPYQGTTPEIPAVLVEAFLPSGDSFDAIPQPLPESAAAPHSPTPGYDLSNTHNTTKGNTRHLWIFLFVLLLGGGVGLGVWQHQRAPQRPQSQPQPRPRSAKQTPTAPRRGVALAPRQVIVTRAIPKKANAPHPRRSKPPKRRRRRIAAQPRAKRRAPKRHCPLAPKGQRWLRIRVTPAATRVLTTATTTPGKRGWRCMLVTPGQAPTLTFQQPGYHMCQFTPGAKARVLRITLRKEADRLNSNTLPPSSDYCR